MVQGGRHSGPDGNRRRVVAIVVIAALILLAFGGGYLLARGGGDPRSDAGSTPATKPSHSRSPKPTPTTTPSPAVSPSPSADRLPDGRSFVYAKHVGASSAAKTLTFDLAEFLTDQAAADAAAAHGDESPPPDGYYIVNDNPKLRTMPISPTVIVRYYPAGGPACCHLSAGTLNGFEAAVNGTAPTDYPDMSYTPWWITVTGGTIVKISQQYLP